MESIDSYPNLLINKQIINGLTKNQLQESLHEIDRQINIYDRIIKRQLEKTMKNYKLCIELCEEKLDLLCTNKEYKTVLATLPSENQDSKLGILFLREKAEERSPVYKRLKRLI